MKKIVLLQLFILFLTHNISIAQDTDVSTLNKFIHECTNNNKLSVTISTSNNKKISVSTRYVLDESEQIFPELWHVIATPSNDTENTAYIPLQYEKYDSSLIEKKLNPLKNELTLEYSGFTALLNSTNRTFESRLYLVYNNDHSDNNNFSLLYTFWNKLIGEFFKKVISNSNYLRKHGLPAYEYSLMYVPEDNPKSETSYHHAGNFPSNKKIPKEGPVFVIVLDKDKNCIFGKQFP